MRRVLLGITMVLLLGATWFAMTKGAIAGPIGDEGSPVRNILYAHVPSSICSLVCLTVLMVASVGYLATENAKFDRVAWASGEVAAVMATILNATGMIFARAEWYQVPG